MKFSRRSDGIKGARAVFKKAREDPRTGHQVLIRLGKGSLKSITFTRSPGKNIKKNGLFTIPMTLKCEFNPSA